MIKVKVTNKNISILGHADYADFGKDIICASVSSVVMCSIEAIANFDFEAVDIKQQKDKLEIIINKEDDITKKLVNNMLKCLKELEKKYPKNIEIIDKEE